MGRSRKWGVPDQHVHRGGVSQTIQSCQLQFFSQNFTTTVIIYLQKLVFMDKRYFRLDQNSKSCKFEHMYHLQFIQTMASSAVQAYIYRRVSCLPRHVCLQTKKFVPQKSTTDGMLYLAKQQTSSFTLLFLANST